MQTVRKDIAQVLQNPVHQIEVGDIAVYKDVPRIVDMVAQVAKISCVSQLIQIDDGFISLALPVEDEVGADKAGSAGDEDAHMLCRTTI